MRDLILETDKMQIRIILQHLIKECETDRSLKNNIETKIKNTPLGMFNYIKEKARKEAIDGCAMIEDSKVYEWAREYWNDYDEKEKVEETKPTPKPIMKRVKIEDVKEIKEKKQKRELKDLYEDDLFGGAF